MFWIRVESSLFDEYDWLDRFDEPLDLDPLALAANGVGTGLLYRRRHKEELGRRRAVEEFCEQELISKLAENPEALPDISPREFESLIAELFARAGMEVELFREVKDDGVDLLAIRAENTDPVVTVISCKHPRRRESGKRPVLKIAYMRELFGTAKLHDYQKAILVTSGDFSRKTREEASLKPDQIELMNGEKVIEWISKYRWNEDE
jgi:HJR/Mrr/RecB family endonuclease